MKVARRAAPAVMALLVIVGSAVTTGRAGAASPRAPARYYVSLGDSYAAGYQPTRSAAHHRDTAGFAYQVVTLARHHGRRLTLRNFACDGATSATVVAQAGCSSPDPGPDDVAYPTQTQAAAAEGFIARQAGQIGLITVSIGGNDLMACTSTVIMDTCLTNLMPTVSSHLATLLAGLRRAAGPDVPIVGLTYPDVFLGLYLSSDPGQKSLSPVAATAFRTIFNPALQAAYRAVGATFVNVTQATGGDTPFTETRPDGVHGAVPIAVAEVCALTYYCSDGDVHPTNQGYRLIARLIVATLVQAEPAPVPAPTPTATS
jgi:lysophospholipase L1-like esterase